MYSHSLRLRHSSQRLRYLTNIYSTSSIFGSHIVSSSTRQLKTFIPLINSRALNSNKDTKPRENPPSVETIEDPDSKLQFPKCITLYDGAPAKLIGFGVRTVSFLKVKVYVVGLYVREQDIKMLRDWRDFDKKRFLSTDDESMAHALLDQPVEFAIRIVPVRDTHGAHLRDGFTKSLFNRIQYMDEELAGDDQSGKELGTIHNHWLAKNLLMGYLAAKNPISDKAKLSIAEGLEELLAADSVF
ncbi:2091_t:CDS:2 [Ambispora gerdemannii]|uniref:2091_t:CDS:1 n=1 Tax=Ambispora gerdemannii TaxID=144530 RepID=A0A9N9BWL6_9GLOM|nr:2091_t:CDS:2 [Ambispora gerdemannii]